MPSQCINREDKGFDFGVLQDDMEKMRNYDLKVWRILDLKLNFINVLGGFLDKERKINYKIKIDGAYFKC